MDALLASVSQLVEDRRFEEIGTALDEAELEVGDAPAHRSLRNAMKDFWSLTLQPASVMLAGAQRAVIGAVAARAAPAGPHLRWPPVSRPPCRQLRARWHRLHC